MEDRRVRRTRNNIQKAFIELLKNYDLVEITVQQIADTADINRATFYKHYEDKYRLLTLMEEEEINKLMKIFNPDVIEDLYHASEQDIVGGIVDMPIKALSLIEQNLELYQVLFQMKRQSDFERKLSELLERNINIISKNSKTIDGIPFEFFHKYMSGAAINVIKHWVIDENRVSKEQFFEYIFKLMFKGPFKIMMSERNL